MKLLQDLLSVKSIPAEQVFEEREEEVGDYLETFMDQARLFRLEGPSGVRNFTKIISAIGYHSLDAFLEDNSGCLEAMVEWIGSQRNNEWVEGIKSQIHEE